jgi:hypothetical protein
MTKPISSDPLKDEQTTRFRNILKGDKDEEPKIPPKSSPPVPDRVPQAVEPILLSRGSRGTRLSAVKPTPESETGAGVISGGGSGLKSKKDQYKSAFWTVTGTLSLVVDAILIAVVIILLFYVGRLNIQMNELKSLSSVPLQTVSGLYNNFEKMNAAHIITSIPFDTEIPVQFDIQINQQTEVVLSQDTPINGARVTLTTGGLEISSAPANIVLPAGTRLPILLTLTVPVNKSVPVHLLVPVDIDLATSELGVPFTGLMDVLEPLYCMLDPLAVDSQGRLICDKARTP